MGNTNCSIHGQQGVGLACIHIGLALDSKERVGFFWGASDGTARPDAWCAACEQRYAEMGPEAAKQWFQSCAFKVLCVVCWDEAKELLFVQANPPVPWWRRLLGGRSA